MVLLKSSIRAWNSSSEALTELLIPNPLPLLSTDVSQPSPLPTFGSSINHHTSYPMLPGNSDSLKLCGRTVGQVEGWMETVMWGRGRWRAPSSYTLALLFNLLAVPIGSQTQREPNFTWLSLALHELMTLNPFCYYVLLQKVLFFYTYSWFIEFRICLMSQSFHWRIRFVFSLD